MKQSEFHKAREGLNDAVVTDRIEEYGTNFIKISVPPILYLVVHEVRILLISTLVYRVYPKSGFWGLKVLGVRQVEQGLSLFFANFFGIFNDFSMWRVHAGAAKILAMSKENPCCLQPIFWLISGSRFVTMYI